MFIIKKEKKKDISRVAKFHPINELHLHDTHGYLSNNLDIKCTKKSHQILRTYP